MILQTLIYDPELDSLVKAPYWSRLITHCKGISQDPDVLRDLIEQVLCDYHGELHYSDQPHWYLVFNDECDMVAFRLRFG